MEDLAGRTLKELLTLARERLGSAAVRLKTRAELLAALQASEKNPPTVPVQPEQVTVTPAPTRHEIITSDFFRRRS